MTFIPASEIKSVSGSQLKEPEKECKHFLKEKAFDGGEWMGQYTGRLYCNSAKVCPYLDKADYNCGVIEYAREYESIMMGRVQETQHYHYVQTGTDKESGFNTFSLLLKTSSSLQ